MIKSIVKVVFLFILAGVASNGWGQNRTIHDSDIHRVINEAYSLFKNDTTGKNANYIPYLDNVSPNLFGIVIITNNGEVYKIGDTQYEFGIESISKIFVLAQAMEIVGPEFIESNIGVGATGMPFNSVIAIELQGQKPGSPIVNAGAMATNSLIKGKSTVEQFEDILNYMSGLANRQLNVIHELYQSEAQTNQHNRAIAMLLESYGHMWADPLDACDSYTKQCSIGITTEDLANMGVVLSNNGVHPFSKKKLIDKKYVPRILAVMGMEGLYESTGSWMYEVGLPGKSGVGGGILAIVPGEMAIAAFAPPLDTAGNSVKAQKAIKYISEKLGLNIYMK